MTNGNTYYYRVFTNRGTLEKIEKGEGSKECRYARTIRDAKAIYGSIVREKVILVGWVVINYLDIGSSQIRKGYSFIR